MKKLLTIISLAIVTSANAELVPSYEYMAAWRKHQAVRRTASHAAQKASNAAFKAKQFGHTAETLFQQKMNEKHGRKFQF